MDNNKNYVGLIIEDANGKLLFQLRDNKPSIPHPNKWSLFGGGIEKNETPLKALKRELQEELDLTIDISKVTLLFKKENSISNRYVFYYKLNDSKKKMRLDEGQTYRFFSLRQILFKSNVVLSLRLFMLLYPFLKRKPISS